MNSKLAIFLLIGFTLISRLVLVNYAPASLNWDEVSHGYNAYSILTTGKDEWGEKMPIIFRAFGDYKLPVYIYSTVISVWAFGLTEVGVRLPSVLGGIVIVIMAFLISREIWGESKNKNLIGFISGLFAVFEPWSFFLSRPALEGNLAQAFVASGIYFLIKSLKTKGFGLLFISLLLLSISVWTYNSARIFVPTFILITAFTFRNTLKTIVRSSGYKYALLIPTGIVVGMIYQLLSPTGLARYSSVNILDQGAINSIIEQRITNNYPEIVERLIFNRPVYFVSSFVKNYVSHFDPYYLFIQGGTHYQFSIPNMGILLPLSAPFVLLGLIRLFNERKSKKVELKLIALWILCAPIASSLTREAPHVLRAITFLPLPMILSGAGVVGLIEYLRSRWSTRSAYTIGAVMVLLMGVTIANYFSSYFGSYRTNYSWAWQYGHKELAAYIQENYDNYDKIVITKKYGEVHEFMLFHLKWNPESYRNDKNLIRYTKSGWYWVDGFDKFAFVNDWQIKPNERNEFVLESGGIVSCERVRCLLVTGEESEFKNWALVGKINFLDGKEAFRMYKNTTEGFAMK